MTLMRERILQSWGLLVKGSFVNKFWSKKKVHYHFSLVVGINSFALLYQFHLHETAPFREPSFSQHINPQGWFSFSGTAGERSLHFHLVWFVVVSGEKCSSSLNWAGVCIAWFLPLLLPKTSEHPGSYQSHPTAFVVRGKLSYFCTLLPLTWDQNSVSAGDTQPRDRGSSEFRLVWRDSLSVFYLALKIPVTNFPHSLLVD